MNVFVQAFEYGFSHGDRVGTALLEHLGLVAVPLALGGLLGLPLGFFSARWSWLSPWVINGVSSLRVIPSIAILFLAIPYFGLSFQSAAIALTILALPPILINTHVAFQTLDPAIQEAAIGMGLSPGQRLWSIEIPLAFPILLAGIKTAAIEVIASATLAAFIGAGGLGEFIVLGFAAYDPSILLVGAIPVAGLALGVELAFSWLDTKLFHP